jgi:hypothetical protein
MSQRTDAEFESIIHDTDAAPAPPVESDDAIHLREQLVPAHAEDEEITGHGDSPAQPAG